MRINDSAEELLELLWITEEEDAKNGLEPSAASQEDFEKLSNLGLVEFNGEIYTRTEAGKVESAMAMTCDVAGGKTDSSANWSWLQALTNKRPSNRIPQQASI